MGKSRRWWCTEQNSTRLPNRFQQHKWKQSRQQLLVWLIPTHHWRRTIQLWDRLQHRALQSAEQGFRISVIACVQYDLSIGQHIGVMRWIWPRRRLLLWTVSLIGHWYQIERIIQVHMLYCMSVRINTRTKEMIHVLVMEFAPDHWARIWVENTNSSLCWFDLTVKSSLIDLSQDCLIVWFWSVSSSSWISSMTVITSGCNAGRLHKLPKASFALCQSPILHKYRGLSSHKKEDKNRSPATRICTLCGITHCLALSFGICNEAPQAEKYLTR